MGRVRGSVRPLDVPITLLNLSLGGFLMQTPMQYQIGETHEFQLTMEQRDPIVVRARSAEQIKAALSHPEVATALVPPDRRDLLDVDLRELTYGP